MNKRHWRLLALPALALAPAAVVAAGVASTAPPTPTPSSEMMGTDAPHQHVEYRDDSLEWGPAPPVFPAGAQMAVLSGDPTADGELFTVRLLMPDGYIIPPHWHPTDENVTVIRGEFLVGLGDTFDEAALLPALEPGDFITAPANANHFAMARGRDRGPGPRHRPVRDDLRQPGRRSTEPVTNRRAPAGPYGPAGALRLQRVQASTVNSTIMPAITCGMPSRPGMKQIAA